MTKSQTETLGIEAFATQDALVLALLTFRMHLADALAMIETGRSLNARDLIQGLVDVLDAVEHARLGKARERGEQ